MASSAFGHDGAVFVISINKACDQIGIGRKHAYLRTNTEARAITDRYSRYRATLRQQREAMLQAQIGEILDERLAEGYEGMSARDIWSRLNNEAQSVSGICSVPQ